ncbi:hypothetical protein [Mycolicibacterium fluoranthenivorans]|uniref:ARB-07466-like C-terminal domain-containing protein n=1 Tax=Mycolicibacterium fluoranthenivorans TaxID=258505 RepID=A0A7X5ZFE5_9MYCO|nr:hypothetical protein [Mycolicibacterium fluoranthenivorans]MCV7358476.1 hypothetical protein [Mycolicibacterium fluoranthenivorans]NIH98052.1 hypothetical protein [Mycolicibacterium fluoranthenivorans]
MSGNELGEYYTLPVIASFEGIDKQVESKLSKVFGGIGKKAGGEMAAGAADGLKALEREVEAASKAYQKLKDKADDALGKVRVEEEKLAKARAGGKSDQIAAAEERRAKALRDSARAAKDAEASERSLHDAQQRLADGTDDLGGRFGKLSGSLSSVGALAGGVALAGIAALGAGALTVGNRLYELGSQFDDLSDSLQTKTGLSGDALDRLKMSVEELGTTNVPSTFGEIGDVAAEVTRSLHLTGEPLEEMTSRLANLQRMGQDVNIRDLGKAFRAFGVDVADQPAALNALYEASTKSGLQIDDMTASVVKSGAALRAAGLDFGESAALVTTFEEAGLDADKMLAGITKSAVVFAKDGKTASQGLRDTVAEISRLIKAGDQAGAQNLANKVFGAKGGVNFFDAIKSGNLDVQALSDSLNQSGLDINDVSDDTADWAERWQDLKNEVAVALEPLAGSVFDGVNDKLTELSEWVSGHKGEVIDFFVDFGEAAISSAEVTTKVMAGIVDLVHLFDTLVMKSLSWLPGYDDEAAKAFNDSLGDLSVKLNAAADGDLWKTLRDGIHNLGEEAKNAAGKNDDLSTSVDGIGTAAGTAWDNVKGLKAELSAIGNLPVPALLGQAPAPGQGVPGQNPLDVLSGPPSGQLPGLPPLIPGGGGRGAGLNLQIAAAGGAGGVPRKVGSDAGLLPQTVAVKDDIASKFTEISDIGGYRADANFPNEHPSGKAIDVMIPNWNTPQGKAYGDQVAAEALKQPGVSYVLWQQRQWNPDGTSTPMEDRGGSTANHLDHVHVHVEPGGKDTDAPAQGQTYRTTSATTSLPGTSTGQNPNKVSAFGASYEPGKGTPGYNEDGEPGYYEQDPKAIRQAQQAIDDANERVKRADQAVAQAEARLAELDADASESQQLSAENAVENAKSDAAKARREADDAKTDAAETSRGKFTAAKEAKKKGGKDGGSGLGPIGEIFGSFLKETTGLDISSWPIMQTASTLLNNIVPMVSQYQSGEWTPGGLLGDALGTTSPTPFGMPDIAVPPMPADGVHPGSGQLPGPAPVTIDASTTIAGNVGWSADEIDKRQQRNQQRAIPRIPIQ